ncbi:MAG TPA: 50S ribosomal protein L18 [Anaerolineae bacterium]|nr:50S ribosomal protein L18 [Anaerolineae bacterium]
MKGTRRAAQRRRHERVRRKISGTGSVPRLSVFRSLKHVYAQIIDDTAGMTLVSASTLDADVRDQVAGLNKTEQAKVVGKRLAEKALSSGVTQVVFDRGGYLYHGRVKALADASREAGLEF